ncbi:protein translocase subunit SecD, partial [Candidatus Neomarinimicrobiota bacterium]
MFRRPLPRFFLITVVLLWTVWALAPTIEYRGLSEDDRIARQAQGTLSELEHKIINLGLDLQGGIHLVLEVDIPTLIQNLALNRDSALEEVIAEAAEEAQNTDADFLDIFSRRADTAGLRLIRYYSSYATQTPEILDALRTQAEDAVNRALEIIRNRVDEFGVSEPTIQKSGRRRIIVELAGIQDPLSARNLIQNTALLEFYLLQDYNASLQPVIDRIDNVIRSSQGVATESGLPTDSSQVTITAPTEDALSSLLGESSSAPSPTGEGEILTQELLADAPFSGYLHMHGNDMVIESRYRDAVENILNRPDVQASLPVDGRFLWGSRPETIVSTTGQSTFYALYYVNRDPSLSGGVITEARANIGALGSSAANQPVVNVSMNAEGSQDWAQITGANIGNRVALVLDNRVQMAPVIRVKIPNGETVIEGLADMDEAKLIAIVLRAGSLPAPVDIIEERSIGPSLGHDSITKGINAALIGGALVILFMVVYYRISGLIATLAVLFNIFLVLAALA